MKPEFFSRGHTRTLSVQLNTSKCKACWKCIEACPRQVIGKVDLPWHKHALLINREFCCGCLNCIKSCSYGAYSKIDKSGQDAVHQRGKSVRLFLINNLLFFSGAITIISGLVLQFGFHIHAARQHQEAGSGDANYEQIRGFDQIPGVWEINYSGWSAIHKISVVCFVLLMIYHIYKHLKWYRGIIFRNLMGKNVQVMILSAIFLFTSLTGILPWIIDLLGSTSVYRFVFVEIHDKLALLLVVFLILHVIKRRNWFDTAYSKIK